MGPRLITNIQKLSVAMICSFEFRIVLLDVTLLFYFFFLLTFPLVYLFQFYFSLLGFVAGSKQNVLTRTKTKCWSVYKRTIYILNSLRIQQENLVGENGEEKKVSKSATGMTHTCPSLMLPVTWVFLWFRHLSWTAHPFPAQTAILAIFC